MEPAPRRANEIPAEPATILQVDNNDIILGRGPRCTNRPSFVSFRLRVEARAVQYAAASKWEKGEIARQLITEAEQTGALFLRPSAGGYELAPRDSVYAKTMHILRCTSRATQSAVRRPVIHPRSDDHTLAVVSQSQEEAALEQQDVDVDIDSLYSSFLESGGFEFDPGDELLVPNNGTGGTGVANLKAEPKGEVSKKEPKPEYYRVYDLHEAIKPNKGILKDIHEKSTVMVCCRHTREIFRGMGKQGSSCRSGALAKKFFPELWTMIQRRYREKSGRFDTAEFLLHKSKCFVWQRIAPKKKAWVCLVDTDHEIDYYEPTSSVSGESNYCLAKQKEAVIDYMTQQSQGRPPKETTPEELLQCYRTLLDGLVAEDHPSTKGHTGRSAVEQFRRYMKDFEEQVKPNPLSVIELREILGSMFEKFVPIVVPDDAAVVT